MSAEEHAFDETFTERWSRRLITGPALLAVTPTYLAALPATLGVAAASDIARGRPWSATRFAAALGANLAMHVAGFGGVFAAWLAGRVDADIERRLEKKMQVWWAQSIWRSFEKLYALDTVVEGDECIAESGPILLLSRHASLVDTLLPLVILGGRYDRSLRYVMKRELLWDPCLDAIGHRWPTAFVRRGTRDAKEIQYVAKLGERLGDDDAVVLFPEGTRFSAGKRERRIKRLEDKPEAAAFARSLEFTLPPHPAGLHALLEADPHLDVVFCAHTGLEGANHFEDLLDDRLLGSSIKMSFWRVARRDIPEDPDERVRWLSQEWENVDRWIAANRESHDDRDGDVVHVQL